MQPQQVQPQGDYPLRGRPEPGQRPNRVGPERDVSVAAQNQTQTPQRQPETAQPPAPKKKSLIKKAIPLIIGGSAASAWGLINFLS